MMKVITIVWRYILTHISLATSLYYVCPISVCKKTKWECKVVKTLTADFFNANCEIILPLENRILMDITSTKQNNFSLRRSAKNLNFLFTSQSEVT